MNHYHLKEKGILYRKQCVLLMRSYNGVIIETWRRHFSIVDTGNCDAHFRADCQPLFVLAGCLLLNYSSLLREEHSPTPALQPFFVLTGVLHFFPGYRLLVLIITPWFFCTSSICVASIIALLCISLFLFLLHIVHLFERQST